MECKRYDLHGTHRLAIPFNPGYGAKESAGFGTGTWEAIEAGVGLDSEDMLLLVPIGCTEHKRNTTHL